MTKTRRLLGCAGVFASLTWLTGCGGLTFVVEGCQGPFCNVTCSVDADCPDGSRCLVGRCHVDDYEGGGGNTLDGGGGDDLGGGDQGGDGGGPSDQPGADQVPGDPTPASDPIVVFGDESCPDLDQDGYCACCPLGLDCDETNPNIHEGAVEICDGRDNNCIDGVDEGVLNACNNCEPYPICNTDTPWTGGSGLDPGDLPPPISAEDGTILEDSDGDGFGSITLATGSVATDFAWPASQTQGTMSRIDTVANIEVGRYAVVLLRNEDPYKPFVADFGPTSQCQQASRSTVDEFGNAYIANRACCGYGGDCFSAQYGTNCNSSTFPQAGWGVLPNANGSVSKIAFHHEILCDPALNPGLEGCQCIDRSGNGRIERSRDYNTPNDGIQVPVCTGAGCTTTACTTDANCTTVGAGSQCIAGRCTTCREDADCAASQYCVRELYASQVRGRCSTTADPVHPCTGSRCADACTDNDSCASSSHYCVRDNTTPANRFCSTTPAIPEFLGKDDECLLWTRRIPGNDHDGNTAVTNDNLRSRPRAMAIDKEGFIWVGDHDRSRIYKLRPDGEFVDPIDDATPVNTVCPRTPRFVAATTIGSTNYAAGAAVPDVNLCLTHRCFFTVRDTCRIAANLNPYGAVIDSGSLHPNGFGYLWITNTNGNLQRIDTETGAKSAVFDTEGAYGITIDQHDRVWLADQGMDSEPNVHRFDPAAVGFNPASSSCPACWTKFVAASAGSPPWSTVGTRWRGRGITTELMPDGSARIWGIFNNDWWEIPNYLLAFDADTGAEITEHRVNIDTLSISPTTGPGCRKPSGVGVGYGGRIWVVNNNTSSVCSYDPNQPFEPLASVAMGPSPYTYSDFTGNLFRSFTKPQGVYRVLVQGCPACFEVADWGLASWEADTPGDSTLEVRFRVGATIGAAQNPANFQDGPVIQPSEIFYDLPFVSGEWLQIEFKFVADDAGLAPKLHHVDVARSCRPRGEGC